MWVFKIIYTILSRYRQKAQNKHIFCLSWPVWNALAHAPALNSTWNTLLLERELQTFIIRVQPARIPESSAAAAMPKRNKIEAHCFQSGRQLYTTGDKGGTGGSRSAALLSRTRTRPTRSTGCSGSRENVGGLSLATLLTFSLVSRNNDAVQKSRLIDLQLPEKKLLRGQVTIVSS